VDGSADASVSATGGFVGEFVSSGSASMAFSVTLRGKVLGEDWLEVADGTETWQDVVAGSEVWAEVPSTGGVWAGQ
jgi:hypothetical protein